MMICQSVRLHCGATPVHGMQVECVAAGRLFGCDGVVKNVEPNGLVEVQFERQDGLPHPCRKVMTARHLGAI